MTAEEPKTTHERSPNQAPNQAPTAGRDPVAGASKPQPGMPASAMPDLQSPADRTTSAVRPPLTDSPWFWVCMFATAALLGLTAAQPKYGRRQAQIEKQYQGREFSVRGRAGTESNQPYSTPDDTLIGLGPLFWVFGIAVAIAWAAFWRQRFRQRSSAPNDLGIPAERNTP